MNRRWTAVLGVMLSLSTAGCGYNRIQSLDEQVNTAQGQIEAQLQRRAELIPNLVATVKGFAAQEERVLTEVTRARAGLVGAIQSGDAEQMANANAQVTGALRQLMVTVEAYPNLKSDQSFLRLQDELTGTENRVAVARQDYNTVVGTYNNYIRQFPQTLTAKVTGAQPRKYFTASAGAQEAPTVDFSQPAAKSGASATPPAAPAPATP